VKNKQKLVLALIAVVFLIVVALIASRWIGQMLIGSVDQIQAAGEAPLPTEDIWIAPTMAPAEDYTAEEAKSLEQMPDAEPSPTTDADGSAPVAETPEQLAGTADKSSIVDTNPGDG
jgi:hypothetical protein